MSRAQGLGARRCVVVVALSMALALGCESKEDPFVIGSKKFTESVLLADVMTLSARHGGIPVRHQREVGGTQSWSALLRGEVDAYPEYTGTLYKEILADETIANREELAAVLEKKGIRLGGNLGFNNTYAIGMRKDRAEELGIRTISDLVGHPDLIFGFDNEFIQREDGWKGLKARYGLPQTDVRGMSHDLSYRGLESGAIDAMEMYTTDGEIEYYDLQTIEDDRQFFPDYKALVLWRIDLEERSPELVAALRQLEGRIDEKRMIAMNSRAKLQRTPEARVAAQFLRDVFDMEVELPEVGLLDRVWKRTVEHLGLVLVSLFAAIFLAIPLGIVAARYVRFGQLVLGFVGILQTIPSLALLVFMIPLLGVGTPPAIVALLLYSLLPIVRNTHSGITTIAPNLLESADAIGLSRRARLRLVELPLASQSILAGIKTSAVINVGTATLGAFIGAGGYGQPILTGIRRDDIGTILEGAIPAAILALLVQGLFELVERGFVPKGLRL